MSTLSSPGVAHEAEQRSFLSTHKCPTCVGGAAHFAALYLWVLQLPPPPAHSLPHHWGGEGREEGEEGAGGKFVLYSSAIIQRGLATDRRTEQPGRRAGRKRATQARTTTPPPASARSLARSLPMRRRGRLQRVKTCAFL